MADLEFLIKTRADPSGADQSAEALKKDTAAATELDIALKNLQSRTDLTIKQQKELTEALKSGSDLTLRQSKLLGEAPPAAPSDYGPNFVKPGGDQKDFAAQLLEQTKAFQDQKKAAEDAKPPIIAHAEALKTSAKAAGEAGQSHSQFGTILKGLSYAFPGHEIQIQRLAHAMDKMGAGARAAGQATVLSMSAIGAAVGVAVTLIVKGVEFMVEKVQEAAKEREELQKYRQEIEAIGRSGHSFDELADNVSAATDRIIRDFEDMNEAVKDFTDRLDKMKRLTSAKREEKGLLEDEKRRAQHLAIDSQLIPESEKNLQKAEATRKREREKRLEEIAALEEDANKFEAIAKEIQTGEVEPRKSKAKVSEQPIAEAQKIIEKEDEAYRKFHAKNVGPGSDEQIAKREKELSEAQEKVDKQTEAIQKDKVAYHPSAFTVHLFDHKLDEKYSEEENRRVAAMELAKSKERLKIAQAPLRAIEAFEKAHKDNLNAEIETSNAARLARAKEAHQRDLDELKKFEEEEKKVKEQAARAKEDAETKRMILTGSFAQKQAHDQAEAELKFAQERAKEQEQLKSQAVQNLKTKSTEAAKAIGAPSEGYEPSEAEIKAEVKRLEAKAKVTPLTGTPVLPHASEVRAKELEALQKKAEQQLRDEHTREVKNREDALIRVGRVPPPTPTEEYTPPAAAVQRRVRELQASAPSAGASIQPSPPAPPLTEAQAAAWKAIEDRDATERAERARIAQENRERFAKEDAINNANQAIAAARGGGGDRSKAELMALIKRLTDALVRTQQVGENDSTLEDLEKAIDTIEGRLDDMQGQINNHR